MICDFRDERYLWVLIWIVRCWKLRWEYYSGENENISMVIEVNMTSLKKKNIYIAWECEMMYMHGYEIAKCDYAKNDEWCCASELVFYSIKKIGEYVLDFYVLGWMKSYMTVISWLYVKQHLWEMWSKFFGFWKMLWRYEMGDIMRIYKLFLTMRHEGVECDGYWSMIVNLYWLMLRFVITSAKLKN